MLKVYVKNMKTIYNIDEFNIFNFCVNSSKAYNSDLNKFVVFKELLHTFHNNEEIYEKSLESYASFISFSVIKEAILQDKNILQYEQYVFSVLSGYYKHNFSKNIDTKILAKIWSNILFIFNKIIDISSSPLYKNILQYKQLYSSFKHINANHNSNYCAEIPLIFEKEDGVDVFLIVPRLKNNYYNILIPFLLSYFKSKIHNLYIIDLSLNSIDYSFTSIPVNNILLNQYRKHKDTLFIDFNKINYQNCVFCPLTCNKNELLVTRFEITPFNKNKKIIRTINI